MASTGGQAGTTGVVEALPTTQQRRCQPPLTCWEQALKFSKFAAIGAIALAAAAAHAGPVSLTGSTDPVTGGSFTFEGTKDASFYVVLDAGTYNFDATTVADGEKLAGVWLSYNKKNNNAKDDIFDLSGNADQNSFAGSYSELVLTQTTQIFLDVNTISGKLSHGGSFSGTLNVSAVPEPTSTALLLAGLGMMAFLGRRRRQG
jgi:hypothetical protein